MRRQVQIVIPAERAGGAVLDFLSDRFTYHTREEWLARMAEGRITVNRCRASPEQALVAGDTLAYDAADIPEPPVDDRITLMHCDEDLVVVNKSGNLTCHPGGRYFNHTLWALLKNRHGIEAPIFVNRIDRETSGLVVVARTPQAAKNLRAQFAGRTVKKSYLALVEGAFPAACSAAGWIVADFAGEVLKKRKFVLVAEPGDNGGSQRRSPASSTDAEQRAAVVAPPDPDAQWAETDFRLRESLGPVSLIEADLHTGRLHQIRVALQALGFPLVGDKMYGVDPGVFLRFCGDTLTPEDRTRMRMPRQALHAAGLQFRHPRTGCAMSFDLPLPADMLAVVQERQHVELGMSNPGGGAGNVRQTS